MSLRRRKLLANDPILHPFDSDLLFANHENARVDSIRSNFKWCLPHLSHALQAS